MSSLPSPDRRALLQQSVRLAGWLAALGLLPAGVQAQQSVPAGVQAQPAVPAAGAANDPRPAFQARTLADVMRALGGAAPQPDDSVQLDVPDVADNGAVVPVRLASTLPGVTRLALLIERNPAMLCALFEPGPRVEPDFSLRVKLAESTDVYAVAWLADGRVRYARRQCTVVLGGCA